MYTIASDAVTVLWLGARLPNLAKGKIAACKLVHSNCAVGRIDMLLRKPGNVNLVRPGYFLPVGAAGG
jgi:hypothetical protein